jgi:hypothetical protein
VGQRLIQELVAQGCPRDATEIAGEGRLAVVPAARVKWIQSQNISRAELTRNTSARIRLRSRYPNKPIASPDIRGIQPRVITLLA